MDSAEAEECLKQSFAGQQLVEINNSCTACYVKLSFCSIHVLFVHVRCLMKKSLLATCICAPSEATAQEACALDETCRRPHCEAMSSQREVIGLVASATWYVRSVSLSMKLEECPYILLHSWCHSFNIATLKECNSFAEEFFAASWEKISFKVHLLSFILRFRSKRREQR